MPTIEFHSSHAHNLFYAMNNESSGKAVTAMTRKVLDKSILWVLDFREDLVMAVEMLPYGIVNNVPLTIHSIIEDPSWCNA